MKLNKYIGKIVGVNLLILLIYSSLLYIVANDFIIYSFLMFILVILHVFICLALSFTRNLDPLKNDLLAYLLSAIAVLLVGASACFGGASFI